MGRLSRSHGVHMRRNGWTLSWNLLESMGSVLRGSYGGFNMPWAASVMLQECFSPWMRRIHDEYLKVKPFSAGWTGMVFWRRTRTNLIMSWPSLLRASLSVASRPLCSRLAWQSLFTMLACSSSIGTLGKIWYFLFARIILLFLTLFLLYTIWLFA